MKSIALLLSGILLLSCGTSKNSGLQDDPTEGRLTGIVHIQSECGALIETKIGKEKVTIFPNNLDEKYKVEGMKLKFYFRNSSMPVPANCAAQSRGNVEDVTPLR